MTYITGVARMVILFSVLCPMSSVLHSLPAEEPARRAEQVRAGLSPEQVCDLLGPPRRVARQILYQRYLEQWVYDGPVNLRVEFECRRGQQAQVQSVQPLRPAGP
jgi:hypothetical protein